jgi:hypothetical protein
VAQVVESSVQNDRVYTFAFDHDETMYMLRLSNPNSIRRREAKTRLDALWFRSDPYHITIIQAYFATQPFIIKAADSGAGVCLTFTQSSFDSQRDLLVFCWDRNTKTDNQAA